MIVTSNLGGPGRGPAPSGGSLVLASVDVEWTKNYRVPNGNEAFCYSVVWLTLPSDPPALVDATLTFGYTSVYVDHAHERGDVVRHAAADLTVVLENADVLAGHQLSSDLAVLVANAVPPGVDPTADARQRWRPAAVAAAQNAWHTRSAQGCRPRVIDTRYDTDAILDGRSRRLVDVCGELDLDVTQPELRRSSMTGLHRRWLEDGDIEARERITVLNLRHSLSAALVALRVLGAACWTEPLNLNRVLDRQLRGAFAWLDHPTFQALTT